MFTVQFVENKDQTFRLSSQWEPSYGGVVQKW